MAAVRSHPIVLAVLGAWTLAPLLVLLWQAHLLHGTLTGADGVDTFDQLQYLAWIRDASHHFLSSDLWQIDGTPHDYLHPLLTVSGLLARAGVPVQLSYLAWRPVSLLVLFVGCAAYIARFLPQAGRSRVVALVLALFYQTPVLAIVYFAGHLHGDLSYSLIESSEDPYAATTLWGFDHTAITIGLTPVLLLAVERVLRHSGARDRRAALLVACAAGFLISWLYPWMAVTVVLILGIMVILPGPRRRFLPLAPLAVAILVPYLYSALLGRADPAWGGAAAAIRVMGGYSTWWALLAEFAPLGGAGDLRSSPPARRRGADAGSVAGRGGTGIPLRARVPPALPERGSRCPCRCLPCGGRPASIVAVSGAGCDWARDARARSSGWRCSP